jgi:large repetitive protein
VRSALAAVGTGGKLYAIGGIRGNAIQTANEAYAPSTGKWTVRAPLPQPLLSTDGATVINGLIYVPAGIKGFGVASNTLYAYNPSTNTWATKAAMPAAGGCGASGAIGGKLYAFSGCDAGGSVGNRFDRYDPSTNTWATLAAPASLHFYPAGGSINGKFYLVGGATRATIPFVLTQALESYDPATGSWKTLAPMPTARYGAATAVINGLLYVSGGYDAAGSTFYTMEVYTPATNTWRTLSSMPTARGLTAGAAVNGVAYVAGGECCGPGTELGTTQGYTP